MPKGRVPGSGKNYKYGKATLGERMPKGKNPVAKHMGAEGPKRSVAGGFGSVTKAVPGGGRKKVGAKTAKAVLKTIGSEGRAKTGYRRVTKKK